MMVDHKTRTNFQKIARDVQLARDKENELY